MRENGALDLKRPIVIKAEPIVNYTEDVAKLEKNQKILHVQRHGQGFHNVMGDVYRSFDKKIDFDSKDEKQNPFVMRELLDSPLTDIGKRQCAERREDVENLNPEVILVSPLLRTIQTAYITFRDHIVNKKIELIANEGCREELGLLACNERRPLSVIREEFPDLNVDEYMKGMEEDVYFQQYPHRRETILEQSDRIYKFLTEVVQNREEKDVAVVGHSTWLFFMMHSVLSCEDDDLKAWFLTSEVRSMKLTFLPDES